MATILEVADFRCKFCNHLLMKGAIAMGKVELKCNHCKRIVFFETPFAEIKTDSSANILK